MKLLWDTHTFLWFVAGDRQLSLLAKELIMDSRHDHYVSIASLWEISIKTALGKLAIQGTYESVIDDIEKNGLQILPITFLHTIRQHQFVFHHRDPFDRIIAAQAIEEDMDLIILRFA